MTEPVATSAIVRVEDMLQRRAELTPDQVALVVDGHGEITYGAWQRRALAAARGLRRHGAAPGELIGIVFDETRTIDYAIAYFGVLTADAVAVPLSARLSVDERATATRALGLRTVVCESPIDLGRNVRAISLGELEACDGNDSVELVAGSRDLAQVIYTSGTTGTSKGVGAPHGNLLGAFRDRLFDTERRAAEESEAPGRFIHALPLATNAGQSMLLAAVTDLETTVVLPRFQPARFCELVARDRIEATLVVPSMVVALLRSDAMETADLSSLGLVGLTGAAMPTAALERLARALPGATVRNFYTSTESWPAGIAMDYDPSRPSSVGRADGPHHVRIAGPDGAARGVGEIGVVHLRMDGVPAREYVGDATASAAVFADGWTRTGDLGYVDGDGYLFLVDRENDVISCGGRKVSSLEVEDVLQGHPAVVAAAVVALPHEVLGEYPAAAVVLDAELDRQQLIAHARERLADHEVPKRLVVVDELPLGPGGKVVKAQVRELLRAQAGGGTPANATERAVADAWREVLGVGAIGRDVHFVDVGGDSLAATAVMLELERVLERSIPPETVFGAGTIAELGAAIDALRDVAEPADPSARGRSSAAGEPDARLPR